jgi:urease accessory protein
MLMVPKPPAALLPRFVRADGGVRVTLARVGARTAPFTIAESGGYRVRFPRSPAGCEGVLINTGGGMAGGDRMLLDISLGEGAEAVMTSQAAEKIYRSQGSDTEVGIRLDLAAGARLDWLPQEQILFDQARFSRTLDVAMAEDSRLTLVESVFFGRAASGEVLTSAHFRDRWRIRRGGRLVFADDVRLEGPVDAILARSAVGAGARACATLIHLAPDAESRLDAARLHLQDSASEIGASETGASAWDGMLLVRFVARDAARLRAELARFLQAFRGAALPRSWQT